RRIAQYPLNTLASVKRFGRMKRLFRRFSFRTKAPASPWSWASRKLEGCWSSVHRGVRPQARRRTRGLRHLGAQERGERMISGTELARLVVDAPVEARGLVVFPVHVREVCTRLGGAHRVVALPALLAELPQLARESARPE